MRYMSLLIGSCVLTTGTLAWPAVGFTVGRASAREPAAEAQLHPFRVETFALRVHRLDAMVAFYTEAFGVRFREVDARGIKSQFGRLGDVTLKLVPIRKSVDFEGFQVHQLGINVRSVDAVVATAIRHSGRLEGEMTRDEKIIHAVIRDPDGNTIELYQVR
jgi:catechol 2,3-dioxygenase-like lactoylglutathione lyase family enzyme